MKHFLILAIFVYTVYAVKPFISRDLEPLTDEIITAINALNTTWKAGKTFKGLSMPLNKLIVTQDETYFKDFTKVPYQRFTIPPNFDARLAWPNCPSIDKIYDQTKGYPSWAYVAASSMADRLCVATGAYIDVVDTVKQIIRSSGLNSEQNSANIGQAFNYWSKKGIFTAKPSQNSTCMPLSTKCQPDEIKLNAYFKVSTRQNEHVEDIYQDIMLHGSSPVYIQVFSDFLNYESGIYSRTSTKPLGMHNVKLIGWGTENGVKYWLATNSWGYYWGNAYVFKLERENGEFGSVPTQISPSMASVKLLSDVPKSYENEQLFTLF